MQTLSRIEGQVLRSVRWSSREERWDHPTLTQLRAFGFVTSAEIRHPRTGALTVQSLWQITDAGVAAYDRWRNT